MVRQHAEPLGDNIRDMSDSEVYQDDHVPEGARPNRWQSLHVVCKYLAPLHFARSVTTINLFIPCNVISDVWHVGASAKNALHCKRLV